jgi:opacity protein-like surface antigen
MKKIVTTLLILTGIYSVSFAQKPNSGEFGVNLGLNLSSIQYSGTGETSDYRAGANIGISGEYYFTRSWGIKAKLIFDQKGWGNGVVFLPDGTEIDGVDYRLNYITVPIMASWHFGRLHNWYVNFGPYLGFLTSASESSNSGDVNRAFSSTDVGLALGVGIKIPINKQAKVFFEYDGQGGFTNVFNQSDGTYHNIRSAFNVGLLFPIR